MGQVIILAISAVITIAIMMAISKEKTKFISSAKDIVIFVVVYVVVRILVASLFGAL